MKVNDSGDSRLVKVCSSLSKTFMMHITYLGIVSGVVGDHGVRPRHVPSSVVTVVKER